MISQERRNAIVGAVIGTEAGAATGLLVLGGIRFAPLFTTLAGALLGAFAAKPALLLRERMFRHALRRQLRGGGGEASRPA